MGLTAKLILGRSSLVIVPIAVDGENLALVGLLKVTMKFSSGSAVESPLTLTVIVFGAVSPAAKLIVPVGKVPPKSAALAGLATVPVTV